MGSGALTAPIGTAAAAAATGRRAACVDARRYRRLHAGDKPLDVLARPVQDALSRALGGRLGTIDVEHHANVAEHALIRQLVACLLTRATTTRASRRARCARRGARCAR